MDHIMEINDRTVKPLAHSELVCPRQWVRQCLPVKCACQKEDNELY
jgi:hypothetical protein